MAAQRWLDLWKDGGGFVVDVYVYVLLDMVILGN